MNTFRNHMAPIVKDTVGINATAYPFDQGVVLVFELGFNIPADTRVEALSHSQCEAYGKAGITDMNTPIGTVIFNKNRIIEVKPYKDVAWTTKVADNIINRLITLAIKINSTEKKEA